MTRPKTPLAQRTRLDALPGHYLRRLNQIAVALCLHETEPWGITPVQYAVLQTIFHHPDLDQRTLARTIGFDASTMTGVIDRLEARKLVVRTPSLADRRVRLLALTSGGRAMLEQVIPGMLRAQVRLLRPLARADRKAFMRMLRTLVIANNEMSRAPSDAD
jgi:DNA-binding MarR family transcriptional regulator